MKLNDFIEKVGEVKQSISKLSSLRVKVLSNCALHTEDGSFGEYGFSCSPQLRQQIVKEIDQEIEFKKNRLVELEIEYKKSI